MKIFLDTNVILDVYYEGRPGKEAALKILQIGNQPLSSRTYLSVLSVANVHYVLRKSLGKEKAKECVRELFEACKVAHMSDSVIYHALRSESPDFEDALQIATAESTACDVIITHNKKHFSGFTPIPVYTPEEFITRCRQS